MSGIEKPDYDVIVVGAGPAGISTAIHLIRLAPALRDRLLILEKDTHPRKKICGGAIGAHTDEWLNRLEINLAISSLQLKWVRFIIEQDHPEKDVVVPSRGFRTVLREEFDDVLFREAVRLGIPTAQSEPLKTFFYDREAIRIKTSKRELTTRILIGANGAKGTVGKVLRRECGIKESKNICPALRFMAPVANGSSFEHRGLEAVMDFSCTLGRGLRGYAWSFPVLIKDQKWLNTGVGVFRVPRGRSHSPREILSGFLATRGISLDRNRLEAHPIQWFDPSAVFSSNRVVLVADAAGVDPLWGEGISFSLGYGQIAARSVKRRTDKFTNEDASPG